MKKLRLNFIISLLIIWLPVVVELLLWNKLPTRIATHFNASMVADTYSSKAFAVFSIPLIMTTAQVLIVFLILHDPKNQNIMPWINYLVMFLVPIIGLMASVMIFSTALGYNLFAAKQAGLSLTSGIVFILIGIVLRRVRPNYTIGIRLPWTLNSDENWIRTHKFAAKFYISGGVLMLLTGLIPVKLLFLPIALIVIIVPCMYSYRLYKKGI